MRKDIANSRFGISYFFAGAGFIGLGIEDVGVKTIVANEMGRDFLWANLCSHKHMTI